MPEPIEWGSVRQIWVAPLNDPSDKTAFLIRDDAYSRSGAVFGRTLRLGDPIDTGPNSQWVQTSWGGGEEQDSWADEEMYLEGTADTTTKLGKVRLWPGWKEARTDATRKVGTFINAAGNATYGASPRLLMGEGYDWPGITGSVSTFKLYEMTSGGSVSELKAFGNPIQAISDIEQESGGSNPTIRQLVGTLNGNVWRYEPTEATKWVNEHQMGLDHIGRHAMCPYNGAVYIGSKYRLSRRTWDDDLWVPTFKKVRDHNWLNRVENLVVWNNRLWFTGRTHGFDCMLFVSEGTTSQQAFVMPGSFFCTRLVVHYGSLYIVGMRHASKQDTVRSLGEVWRYNGSSLTRIWAEEVDDGSDEHLPVWDATSWRQYLVWGRASAPSIGRPPSLMLYDAELDAIVTGPSWDIDANSDGVQVSGVTVWQDTLAASLVDLTTYSGGPDNPNGTFFMRRGGQHIANSITGSGLSSMSFAYPFTSISRKVVSSVYDGETPGEEKVWLSAKVRCKVPADTRVVVKAIFDEDETEVTLGTITYDAAQLGWRNESVSMKVAGEYVKSTTVQYVIYVENTDPTTSPLNTPEVDSLSVDFMLAPAGRSQWRVRVLANDAQVLLDDSNNPLTTRDAIVSAVEDLWSDHVPILYWDAGGSGDTPVGAGTEVMVQDFFEQSYRVSSDSEEVASELTMGLVEFGGS